MNKVNDPRHTLKTNDQLETELVENILKDYSLGLTVEAIAQRHDMNYYRVKSIIAYHMLS